MGGLSEMGGGSQNVRTSRYNINKSRVIIYTIHRGDSRSIFLKISLRYNWHVTLVSSVQHTDSIFVCISRAPSPPTRWTWVWVSSGSWWWTGKPGVLHAVHGVTKSQTQLSNWTELTDGDNSQWYCVVYLKVAKRVSLKNSTHKKKKFMTMCGDRFKLDLLC